MLARRDMLIGPESGRRGLKDKLKKEDGECKEGTCAFPLLLEKRVLPQEMPSGHSPCQGPLVEQSRSVREGNGQHGEAGPKNEQRSCAETAGQCCVTSGEGH